MKPGTSINCPALGGSVVDSEAGCGLTTCCAIVLFLIASFPVHGNAVEPGNYLVLKAQLIGCDQRYYIVDYAKVSDSGYISVLEGIEMSVAGLAEAEIAQRLADVIGERLGRIPKTLTVEAVQPTELKRVAEEFMAFALSGHNCLRPPEHSPPLEKEYIRSLAHAPPSHEVHPTLDAARLSLPLQAVRDGCGRAWKLDLHRTKGAAQQLA